MKIAIPTDSKQTDTTVCPSFGRTPFYALYDTETKAFDFMDNGAMASTGGAGIKAAQSLVDAGIEVLLTPRCGENAADVLNAAGIKIFKTAGTSVPENIKAYQENRLEPLTDVHPGFHHGG
jgi:predicted Fe-Mo cluster-binding NifX family protein